MSKTTVDCTRKHELRDTKLLDPPKSLELWRINQPPSELVEIVILLKDDQAVDGVPETLCAKCHSLRFYNRTPPPIRISTT
jgi:hypothetical protein